MVSILGNCSNKINDSSVVVEVLNIYDANVIIDTTTGIRTFKQISNEVNLLEDSAMPKHDVDGRDTPNMLHFIY